MGASDGIVLPLQAEYAKRAIAIHGSKKIAWIGAPLPYSPSEAVRAAFPQIEQHFLDPIASNTATTQCFDVNTSGWGKELAAQGFDMLIMFRVAIHIADTTALVSELSDFLESEVRKVIFEDMRGISKYKQTTTTYRLHGKEFHALQNHEQHEALISESFNVFGRETVTYADPDITGLYLTLARKKEDQVI